MKYIIQKVTNKVSLSLLVTALAIPSLVYGEEGSSGDGGEGTTSGQIIKLKNPLKVNSIAEFLKLILDIVTLFALPIIIFFIIYAGFLFVTAQGKPDQITKARNALLWSVVGGVIILGANLLLTVIQGTVGTLLSP